MVGVSRFELEASWSRNSARGVEVLRSNGDVERIRCVAGLFLLLLRTFAGKYLQCMKKRGILSKNNVIAV